MSTVYLKYDHFIGIFKSLTYSITHLEFLWTIVISVNVSKSTKRWGRFIWIAQ